MPVFKRKNVVRLAIAVVWLAAVAWFVRYEAFPGWFADALGGYRGMLSSGPVIFDSWMKISFKDQPIGYSHTRVDTNEKDPAEQFVVQNRTVLDMNIMGESQTITVTTEAALDALYQLQRFAFRLFSRSYTAQVHGRRFSRSRFLVRMWTGGSVQRFALDVPDDVVLYSPFIEMSLSRLQPGQQLKVRTLDPASLAPADIIVRAEARETVATSLGDREAVRLSMDMHGAQFRAWVDAEGRLLRQETPFGWVMETCTSDEALAFIQTPGSAAPDVLRALSVPVDGPITDPRSCRRLLVQLSGVPIPPDQIQSPRQSVRRLDDRTLEIDVRAASAPKQWSSATAGMEKWLESTAFVQADHPDIRKTAKSVTKNAENPVEAARALHEWVFRRVSKVPTVSLPSALDVLRRMEGDCNEHTYLFVALARAAGLPAQIRVGLVYVDGAFYYHAWPAVYVGEWWEMDPTMGQESVDATHIALLEGELSAQVQLVGVIGRAAARVLAQEY